jgi:F-type H+-transporting ATPase subunit delta
MAKNTTHKSAFAVAYASSLLELANEKQQAEPIGQELREIRQIVAENRTFALFLADPGISETERGNVIGRVFGGGRVSPLMQNFLGVLNRKGRLGALVEIADAYDDLLDEQLGKIEVDVTVAQKLTPEQLEEVRRRVSAALKKDAVVHQYVDDSIIGGLVIRVQDKLLDASVRTQLAAMKQRLIAGAGE